MISLVHLATAEVLRQDLLLLHPSNVHTQHIVRNVRTWHARQLSADRGRSCFNRNHVPMLLSKHSSVRELVEDGTSLQYLVHLHHVQATCKLHVTGEETLREVNRHVIESCDPTMLNSWKEMLLSNFWHLVPPVLSGVLKCEDRSTRAVLMLDMDASFALGTALMKAVADAMGDRSCFVRLLGECIVVSGKHCLVRTATFGRAKMNASCRTIIYACMKSQQPLAVWLANHAWRQST